MTFILLSVGQCPGYTCLVLAANAVPAGHSVLFYTRLAKRREILIFPRTAGNTGNSREILVIPGIYWEIVSSLTRKV